MSTVNGGEPLSNGLNDFTGNECTNLRPSTHVVANHNLLVRGGRQRRRRGADGRTPAGPPRWVVATGFPRMCPVLATAVTVGLMAAAALPTQPAGGSATPDITAEFLARVAAGAAPVGLRLCPLLELPARTPTICNVTGIWRFNWDGACNHTILESPNGNGSFVVTSACAVATPLNKRLFLLPRPILQP